MAAADLALKLIAAKGRNDGVVRRPSKGVVPDASRPWAPGHIGTDPILAEGVAIVLLDIESYRAAFGRDAVIAPEVSAMAMIAAKNQSFIPEVGDLLVTRGLTYSTVKVDTLAPAMVDVMYILHLKS